MKFTAFNHKLGEYSGIQPLHGNIVKYSPTVLTFAQYSLRSSNLKCVWLLQVFHIPGSCCVDILQMFLISWFHFLAQPRLVRILTFRMFYFCSRIWEVVTVCS